MDVKVLNNVSEAYGANLNDSAVKTNPVNSDNSTKVNEQKAQERKNTDSFSDDAASLTISDNSREAASANGKIVLASEDGIVIEKERTATENLSSVESQADKAANGEEEQISNLSGYSSNQVETLYRQGKVSKTEYDQKMEQLEEMKEAVSSDEEKKEDTEAVVNENKNVEIQNEKKALEEKESKKASEEKSDKAKESTEDAIKNNRAQSEELGKILESEEEDANKASAFQKAEENDRVELIEPLFNDDAKKQEVVTGASVLS